MPLYLVRFSYTAEAWKKLVQNPEDRSGPVGDLIESLGGKLQGLWYAFGDHDGYLLVEAPDNVSAAAVSIAASAGAGVSSLETTVLMTVEELLEALKKAAGATYKPPGG
jgi:uncharacterized protein with GYD domain